jgi:hypothetical protein
LFNCPSVTNDQLSSAFSDLSLTIARHVRNSTCFAGARGVLSEDWSAHKEWATARSRSDLVNNMQWKMSAAFRCLNRAGKSSLFADSSVAMAKASFAGSGTASAEDQ